MITAKCIIGLLLLLGLLNVIPISIARSLKKHMHVLWGYLIGWTAQIVMVFIGYLISAAIQWLLTDCF